MLRNKRGQIRVIEAFLASAVILSALLVAIPLRMTTVNLADMKSLHYAGLNVLAELDRDGTLGHMIATKNWTVLSKRLSILLPVGAAYNLTVTDEDAETVNDSSISGGGALTENVLSVTYLLAERTNCKLYVISLQLSWIR
jgi:hypothetical protein